MIYDIQKGIYIYKLQAKIEVVYRFKCSASERCQSQVTQNKGQQITSQQAIMKNLAPGIMISINVNLVLDLQADV